MPEVRDITDEITKVARDAVYVVVGLGVLGFQKAQVRRQQLSRQLSDTRVEDRIAEVREGLTKQVKQVDERLEQVIDRLETSFEPYEGHLPAQARDLVKQAQTQAREARQQLRTLIAKAA